MHVTCVKHHLSLVNPAELKAVFGFAETPRSIVLIYTIESKMNLIKRNNQSTFRDNVASHITNSIQVVKKSVYLKFLKLLPQDLSVLDLFITQNKTPVKHHRHSNNFKEFQTTQLFR